MKKKYIVLIVILILIIVIAGIFIYERLLASLYVNEEGTSFSILPTYKVKNSDINSDEQQMIIKALESLATSYTNDTLNSLIEKYNAIIEKIIKYYLQ